MSERGWTKPVMTAVMATVLTGCGTAAVSPPAVDTGQAAVESPTPAAASTPALDGSPPPSGSTTTSLVADPYDGNPTEWLPRAVTDEWPGFAKITVLDDDPVVWVEYRTGAAGAATARIWDGTWELRPDDIPEVDYTDRVVEVVDWVGQTPPAYPVGATLTLRQLGSNLAAGSAGAFAHLVAGDTAWVRVEPPGAFTFAGGPTSTRIVLLSAARTVWRVDDDGLVHGPSKFPDYAASEAAFKLALAGGSESPGSLSEQ